jgi:hypothetical protein
MVKIKLSAEQVAELASVTSLGSGLDSALRVAMQFHSEHAQILRERINSFWKEVGAEHGLPVETVGYAVVREGEDSYVVEQQPVAPADMHIPVEGMQ